MRSNLGEIPAFFRVQFKGLIKTYLDPFHFRFFQKKKKRLLEIKSSNPLRDTLSSKKICASFLISKFFSMAFGPCFFFNTGH